MKKGARLATIAGIGMTLGLTPALGGTASAGPVAAPSAQVAAQAVAAKKAPRLTLFTYRTFIRQKYVKGWAVKACLKNPLTSDKFGGDNRSYSTKINTGYRSNMTVGISWPSKKGYTAKSVGYTKRYSKSGKLKSRKKASTKNMKFSKISVTSSKATFTLDHSATNPYCAKTGGAIRYKVKVTLWRSGKYSLSGYRRKAPEHEAFIRYNSIGGKSYWVMRKKNVNFKCLVAALCKTETLKISGKA